jgi:hypothetical protein
MATGPVKDSQSISMPIEGRASAPKSGDAWPLGLPSMSEKQRDMTRGGNATVETKHPRGKRTEGASTYRLSDLTVIELIKREVQRVIKQNRSSDVSRRTPDRAIVEDDVNSPNQLHAYLMKRHRSSLIHITFEEAVRAFLDPAKIIAKKGRLYFKGREYTSQDVFSSGLANQIAHSKNVELDGYVYPLVSRLVWIEFNGHLIEVRSKERQPDDLASVAELEYIEPVRSKASGKRQAESHVKVLAAQDAFFQETGKECFAGQTRKGRAKVKTKLAIDVMQRIKALN